MHGEFKLVAYRDKPSGSAHLALIKGVIDAQSETLVRVHEPASLVDLLETERSTHSWPVHKALAAIAKAQRGVLVLLNCDQKSSALFGQLERLSAMQDPAKQAEAVEKTTKMDLRTYGVGAQILKDLHVGKMRLLSKPRKMPSMAGFELQVAGYESV